MGERLGRSGIVMLLVVIAAVAGVGVGLLRRPMPIAAAEETLSTTPPQSQVDVHVGGWVVSPGVVSLPEGSIVADAVVAAGGMRPGASSDAINLAAQVDDGDQVIVPGPGDDDPQSAGGDGLIDLNQASVTDLQALPGVGPVLAERIVGHRDANGPFDEVEDLLEVPGIGEAKLAAIRDLVET